MCMRRYHAHTENCAYCRAAYRNLEAARLASLGALLAAVVLMPEGRERTVAALAAAGVAAGLSAFNRLFVRYEYSHADND